MVLIVAEKEGLAESYRGYFPGKRTEVADSILHLKEMVLLHNGEIEGVWLESNFADFLDRSFEEIEAELRPLLPGVPILSMASL